MPLCAVPHVSRIALLKARLSLSDTPKPTHLRIIRDSEDIDARDTMEIPTAQDFSDERAGILLALPTKTFARGEIIVDIEHLPFFYLIVRGTAEESALSSLGETNADLIVLRPDDVIGIHRIVRVIAKTDLTVRVIDFREIRKTGNRMLFDRASEIVREAAIGASTQTRDRLIRIKEDFEELQIALEKLLVAEHEMNDLRVKNAEHVKNGKMLSKEILNQREIIADFELRLGNREIELSNKETEILNRHKELESAASITKMYKEDYFELVQEFANYAGVFETLQSHSDPRVSNRGVQLLGLLHALRVKSGGF